VSCTCALPLPSIEHFGRCADCGHELPAAVAQMAAELDGRAAAQTYALQRRLGYALLDDVRRSLKSFDAMYRKFMEAAHLTQETDANLGDEDDDVGCPTCGGDGIVHDCGEDTCCCADKSPNVPCPDCGGQG
jgi:hypothetical protein